MNDTVDNSSDRQVSAPSLFLACFGFAASTTAFVGFATVLSSLS